MSVLELMGRLRPDRVVVDESFKVSQNGPVTEAHVCFPSGPLTLEGLFEARPGDKGMLVTHPHPVYGGDMHSNVVAAAVEAYAEAGYTTLRFNFRGVGASEGTFDNGIGEQDDISSALRYLKESGKANLDLVGYSFGAWVNAHGFDRFRQAARFVLISPPAAYMGLDFLGYDPKIRLVVVGGRDEIAGTSQVKTRARHWNPQAEFQIIEGADHFFSGKTEPLKEVLRAFLSQS